MSQPCRAIQCRPALPLAGLVALSAALAGGVLTPFPAHAQALGGVVQRQTTNQNNNAPQRAAPPQASPGPLTGTVTQRQVIPTTPPVANAPIYRPPIDNRPVYNSPFANRPTGPGSPSDPILRRRDMGSPFAGGALQGNSYSTSAGSLGRRNENAPIHQGRESPNDGRVRTINPRDTTPDHLYGTISTQHARSTRVTTPSGPTYIPNPVYDNNYLYSNGGVTVITDGPVLLGGYYYGNYCNESYGPYSYPSIYSSYWGFPRYIYNPAVIVVGQPYYPAYYTPYLPFYTPNYQVTYNQNNYYVGSQERADEIEAGGTRARSALKSAYPAGSYQAAFADIARAWTDGNIALIRKHLRDSDTKISVFLKKKYTYSIASSDFEQITRDALDRLATVSFEFTRLRKAKNGDVTAFGKHVYRVSDTTKGSDDAGADDTVPFDQERPYDKSGDPGAGEEKTVYVSYTLRHHDDQWYIIAVDSSSTSLVTD